MLEIEFVSPEYTLKFVLGTKQRIIPEKTHVNNLVFMMFRYIGVHNNHCPTNINGAE